MWKSKDLVSPWLLLRQSCMRLVQWPLFSVCRFSKSLPIEDECHLPLLSALHSCSYYNGEYDEFFYTIVTLIMKVTLVFKGGEAVYHAEWAGVGRAHLTLFSLHLSSSPIHIHNCSAWLGQRFSYFPEAAYKI